MEVKCKVDKGGFENLLREVDKHVAAANKMAATEYGKIFCGMAVRMTPPAGGRVQGAEAKHRQEQRIKWDILGDEYGKKRFFWKGKGASKQLVSWDDGAYHLSPFMIWTGRRKNAPLVDPEAWLKQFSYRRKRGNGGVRLIWSGKRVWAAKGALMRVYNEKIRHVGRLASGWMAGCVLVGRKTGIPAWVRRHGVSGGSAKYEKKGKNCYVRIANQQGYHEELMDVVDNILEEHVKDAVARKSEEIKKWLCRQIRKSQK